MQKTIHANKRRILAILLCIAVIAGCLPFSAQEAYAASGTVNYKKGDVLEYGSHWTNFMYVDGSTKNVAYCADPTKASPDEGSHSYELLAKDSAYRKALYYMPGGYGYDKVMKEKCFSIYPRRLQDVRRRFHGGNGKVYRKDKRSGKRAEEAACAAGRLQSIHHQKRHLSGHCRFLVHGAHGMA